MSGDEPPMDTETQKVDTYGHQKWGAIDGNIDG